jgi:ATP-dependent DNA helicase DinG
MVISPEDILAESGPLSEIIQNYQVRPQQIDMAEAIEEAIYNNQSIILEAGTGTGKTFAYLIPAILSGKKIIVSTGTKHLQDQLYKRDLKTIQQATGMAINTALLKGRANYLCLHRLALMENEQTAENQRFSTQLFEVRQWANQTDLGDMSELTVIPEDAQIRYMVTSTTENCLGAECAFYDDCHVFKARRKAADSDLTVVNHHLLLADMALREKGYGEILPNADMVIFDEAHQLPDLATQFFGQSLSSNQFYELVRDSRQAYFSEAADMKELLEYLDKLDIAIRQFRLALNQYDTRAAWFEVKKSEDVENALAALFSQCMDIHQILDAFANRGKELNHCFKRFDGFISMLNMFINEPEVDHVQWLEIRGRGFLLHQTPLNVSEIFQKRMADYDCQCVYTSATLAVKENFNHYINQMGLDNIKHHSWASPFDFKKQAMLYLPEGLPDPRASGFTEHAVDAAIPVIEHTRGRAFFLFTSHRALQIAAEIIRNKISYPVLIQGDAPRTELLETFRNTPHGVLLGTSSFWEGVDVKGQALSCVIIDKLPFSTPDDPVLKAKLKKIEELGGNAFMEYQLPEAVISLKQGIGRLIRDSNDYGVLMICDPRLRGKSYGKVFLKSMPEMKIHSDISEVGKFFEYHERVND